MDKRRGIQFLSALIYNADLRGFFTGKVSRSPLKRACVPGLNCYSCPGAVSSCPLGALQNFLGSGRAPWFVTGFLLLLGTLIGRAVCAFLCPFGLIQELLYKIPSPKLMKNKATRALTWLKYALLATLVVALPLGGFFSSGIGEPFFCAWVCPAGTLEAGIPLVALNVGLRAGLGFLFAWKLGLLGMLVVASVFIYRPFCRFICPLGAIYSFFNRVAIFGVRLDASACVGCDACVRRCKMDVKRVNDRECIRCGECAAVCPTGAIKFDWKRAHFARKETL